MRQLRQQHRRLQAVEAGVGADFVVVVLLGAAVEAQLAQALGDRAVRRHHHAAVAPSTEVLAREEREARDPAQLARHAPRAADPAARADGLGRVLDDPQAVTARRGRQPLQLGHLSVQVHGDERPRPRRHHRLDRGRRDVERVGVDVREHGHAARVVNRARRGEEGERGSDHLVAGLELQRPERQEQRVGPARARNPVRGVRQAGHCRLELPDGGTHDELLRLDDRLEGGEDLVLDGAILRHEVQQGDVHGARVLHGWARVTRHAGSRQSAAGRRGTLRRRRRTPHRRPGRPRRPGAPRTGTSSRRAGPARRPSGRRAERRR